MNVNRPILVSALLLLAFFVSTSAGFANLSSIQEKLRETQLKLIKAKIQFLQDQISNIAQPKKEAPPAPVPERAMTRKEIKQSLEDQIKALEQVVASLKPRVLEEETARLEKRIAQINAELQTATGSRVLALQEELGVVITDYNALQLLVMDELNDSIKARQVSVLQEQIKVLREKINLLPKQTPVASAAAGVEPEPSGINALKGEIEKVKLRLLQAQVKAIQEKINQIKK